MELITLTTPFIAFIHIVLLARKFKFNTASKIVGLYPKLPPGQWKLPVIGNLHNLSGSLPDRALTDLAKKHGQVMHLQLGEVSTFVVSGARMAKQVLQTHDVALANRPKILSAEIITYNYHDVAFAPYGDYWRQMRKICVLELLSSKSVRAPRSIREDEVWKMIGCIQSMPSSSILSRPVNLTEKAFALTNAVTCTSAFGSRCKYQDELVKLINEIIEVPSGFDIADLFPSKKFLHIISGTVSRLKKLQSKLDPIFENIIQEHKERNGSPQSDSGPGEEGDLVDVLLKINSRGGLDFPISTESIKAIFVDMFAAGTDTSAATILWVMSELIRHPRVMETAQAEVRNVGMKGKSRIHEEDLKGLNYLKSVIKETLRLHPPVPLLLPRECREECEIGGYDVSIGTRIIINGWAINRATEFWEDAETFKPERFLDSGIEFVGTNFEYLLFGGGRRICPGISFGLASVELALAQLLYHFDWKLPNGAKPESLDMTEDFGATIKRKNSLCLVAIPHFPFE